MILQDILNQPGDQTHCPIAIIVRDQKILLGFRNYTIDKWKKISVWTTPGGRCDAGETIEQTLRREVKEEIGVTDLEILDFIGESLGAKKGDLVPIFFCNTNQEPQLMEPEKFSEWKWVPLKDYIIGGEWKDMNPVAHEIISGYLIKKFNLI